MAALKINGKETVFPEGKVPVTITDLLRHLGVDAATVVAEMDGRIIERGDFSQTRLFGGESIELVRFVPGG